MARQAKLRVTCFASPLKRRSVQVAKAMSDGFARHGIDVSIEEKFIGVNTDLAVAYGWINKAIFAEYRAKGRHFLYIDLGFWHRRGVDPHRYDGYHKVVIDNWCPVETMQRGCPGDRLKSFGVELKPSKPGEHIVIGGMSERSALDHGFAAEQWEREAIRKIAAGSRRRIVYRPKPSWKQARAIPGADYAKEGDIQSVLDGAHALVTHHSNTAVDAIVAGVPVHCESGVGSLLSTVSFEDIDHPRWIPTEEERLSVLQDVAYLQWSIAEMRSGACWEYYRGLLG